MAEINLVKLPDSVDLEGSTAYNDWNNFEGDFENYLIATGKDESSDKVKIALLKNMLGTKGRSLFDTFDISDEDKGNYKIVKEAYRSSKLNPIYERFVLSQRTQQEGESFDHFLTDCKRLIKHCGFDKAEPQEEDVLIDRIVQGINNKSVQESLLQMENATLNKVAAHCRAVELSSFHAMKIQEKCSIGNLENVEQVYSVQKNKKLFNKDIVGKQEKTNLDPLEYSCGRCQTKHKPRKCPAFGKKCGRCGLYNHFAVACRVRKVRNLNANGSSSDSSSNCDSLKLHSVTPNRYGKNRVSPNEWRETILIENKLVNIKLDK